MDPDRRQFRPLLPRQQPRSAQHEGFSLNVLRAAASVQLPKRIVSPAACDACRRRKVKCDAKRPNCGSCTRIGESCNYSTEPAESRAAAQKRKYEELERRLADYEALQDILDSRPTEGEHVLERLRSSKNVHKTLQAVREGSLLLELAQDLQAGRARAMKEGQSSIESPPDHIQHELNEQRYLIRRLRTMSDADALRTLHRLRTAPSEMSASEALVSAMDPGSGLIQPSAFRVRQGLLPPTLSSIESELLLLHPNVYTPIEPFEPGAINVDDWFRPLKRTANSSFAGDGSRESSQQHGSLVDRGRDVSQLPINTSHTSWESSASSLVLFQDRQLCDARLSKPNMKYWTNVPINDELASHVLSHFFTVHYPIFACFDAELFIEDLCQTEVTYCSKLLVAGIMSIACQSFSTFDPGCSRFSVLFEQEGEELWRAAQDDIGPNRLAAMCYLAMASGMSGHEDLAFSLLADIRVTAEKLKLFGSQPEDEAIDQLYELPTGKLRSLAAAAWGAYSWLTFHALYYPGPIIAHPPTLPIPGDPDRRMGKKVWPPHPLPGFVGQTFTYICKLWVISRDIRDVYTFDTSVPSRAQSRSLAEAELSYQKLLAWSDGLGEQMGRDGRSISHLYFFHAIYHLIVLRLFHPFLERSDEHSISSFRSKDAKPAMIYAASMRQMKRILVLYSIKCGKNSDNGWFMAAVLQITSVILRTPEDPDWRIYFQLCFNFWREAYIRYRVYLKVAEANLSFALQLRAVKRKTAIAMIAELQSVGLHHVAPEIAYLSAIVDYQKASEDIVSSKMDVLASEFRTLTVEHPPGHAGEEEDQPVDDEGQAGISLEITENADSQAS